MYVSLPPGSVPGGDNATVRDLSTGQIRTAPMLDGGFDPVPLPAHVGDTLDVEIHRGGVVIATMMALVPPHRPPTIVRTDPPKGQTDVPLNTQIAVVFSEPVDSATSIGAVRLFNGNTLIAGTASLSETGIVGNFAPNAPLAPRTLYSLVVDTSVRSSRGEPLDSAVHVSFTTGSSSGVASLLVAGPSNPVSAGATVTFTVTAGDPSGNKASNYTGRVQITSTDPAAQLPPNYTFATGDAGSHTFSIVFQTVGTQTLTVTDVAASSITGSASVIVVGSSKATDVFAVGGKGTILHFDGSSWTPQARVTGFDLWGVWGASGSDVFAVGEHGTILHYDGSAWTAQATPDTAQLLSVWGSSGRDVFAVGEQGTILHFDGTTWTRQMRDTTLALLGVWGSSGSDVFAVGLYGTILHYDGTSWHSQLRLSTVTTGGVISLDGVWGTSGTDVFAVGDSILHYDGARWNTQRVSTLSGVWGTSGNDVFAVGDYGSIMHYDGSSWSLQDCDYCHFTPGWPQELFGIWGISSSDVFAVGDGIVHYDGTRWTVQPPVFGGGNLFAIWGSSRSK